MTKKIQILNGQHRLHTIIRYTSGYTAGYCIMDQRALYDVDRATILQVCVGATLVQARRERDRDWPGQCLVDMQTWEVVDAHKEYRDE